MVKDFERIVNDGRIKILYASEWIYEGVMRHRVVIGEEPHYDKMGIPDKYATWEESHEYAGKNAKHYNPQKPNMYWGHYCMSKVDAIADFGERVKKQIDYYLRI